MCDQGRPAASSGYLLGKGGLAFLGAVFALAAWNGETTVASLVGLILSAAGLSRLWSALSLRALRCERGLSHTRAFPGDTVEWRVRLANGKFLPLPWVQVEDRIPAQVLAPQPLPPGALPGSGLLRRAASVLGYGTLSWGCPLQCMRRGYFPLGPLQVTTGDLFGFYPRTMTVPRLDPLVVYPRIFPLDQLGIPSLAPLGETAGARRIFQDPSRVLGVREYTPGDSLRHVHWKASARTQSLQVKCFEPTVSLKLALFLAVESFCREGAWDEEALELAISTAASVASDAVGRGHAVGLYVNTRLADSGQAACLPPGGSRDQLTLILEGLAKTTACAGTPCADLIQAERAHLPWGTTVVLLYAGAWEALPLVLEALREGGLRHLLLQVGPGADGCAPPHGTWLRVERPPDLLHVGSERAS